MTQPDATRSGFDLWWYDWCVKNAITPTKIRTSMAKEAFAAGQAAPSEIRTPAEIGKAIADKLAPATDEPIKYRMVMKFDGGVERVYEGEYPAPVSATRTSAWIPVSERLPNPHTDLDYICATRTGYVTALNFGEHGWYADAEDSGKDGYWNGCVTHWMDLPEAPK